MANLRLARESTVALLAGLMLVFTGWAWGGVLLWTQFATCGLGALALLVALTPRDRSSPFRNTVRQGYATSIVLGLLLACAIGIIDWLHLAEQRASTFELNPDAALPPLAFADWGLRGLGIGAGLAALGLFAVALRTPTQGRAILLRFPPFWIGLALLSFIALQALNPWGVVVNRDLFWRILPVDHITWLPAGLDAPFSGNEEPGAMNGWRQLLILSGPWMLLCALRTAVWRRSALTKLAWVVGLNSLAVAVVGHSVAAGKEFSFLGFRNWYAYHAPFGPFIYKNHAGIYLYLSAALVLALTAHLIARKGDRADRGGPHLIAGLLFVMLCLASASTLSMGSVLAAGIMILVAPALYFIDRNVRSALSPAPALMLLGCGILVGYVVLSSSNLDALMRKAEKKQAYLAQNNTDDRAPIRRATLAQIHDGDAARLAYGWGAGCYRWTSPLYFAKQPEFVDSRGRLWAQASYAHCDWLQALLEWGIVGCTLLVVALLWLATKLLNAWRRRSASLLALSVGILLVLLHALLDFTFYFTPALTLLALMIAWLASAEDADTPSSPGWQP